MRSSFVVARVVVSSVAVLASLSWAAASDGPWVVVADSGDSSVIAFETDSGAVAGRQTVGSQALGVAAVGRRLAISDFVGGSLRTFSGQSLGDFVGSKKSTLPTAPDLLNPEGIIATGRGNLVLVGDGVTQVEGQSVALQLWDIGKNVKLSQVSLPSVYSVAFSNVTGLAFVLDGFSNQIAIIKLNGTGQLSDTGTRIDLTGGPSKGGRFVALDEAHKRLLVSFKLQGVVEVIDLVSGSSAGTIGDLGTAIGGIAITPDGSKALVADFGGSKWEVLDLTADGLPAHVGTVNTAYGVPNTFAGTKTWAFLDDVMYFSATLHNGVCALNWQTLELLDVDWPTGVAPAGMDLAR